MNVSGLDSNTLNKQSVILIFIATDHGVLITKVSWIHIDSTTDMIYAYELADDGSTKYIVFSKYNMNLEVQARVAFWSYESIHDNVGFSGKLNQY